VRLPSLVGPEAERLLEALGYAAEGGTVTLAGPVGGPPAPEVEIAPLPSPEWLAAQNRMNAREGEPAQVFDAILARLDAPAAFAGVRREGRLVSTGYAAIAEGWLCVEAVVTDPAWRGRGLAGETVSALLAWGATAGAQAAALQVTADNAPAVRLYQRLGFARELYRYHYRTKTA
jgi:ribosomal protein S18 acetylase RimI-like enzyme